MKPIKTLFALFALFSCMFVAGKAYGLSSTDIFTGKEVSVMESTNSVLPLNTFICSEFAYYYSSLGLHFLVESGKDVFTFPEETDWGNYVQGMTHIPYFRQNKFPSYTRSGQICRKIPTLENLGGLSCGGQGDRC